MSSNVLFSISMSVPHRRMRPTDRSSLLFGVRPCTVLSENTLPLQSPAPSPSGIVPVSSMFSLLLILFFTIFTFDELKTSNAPPSNK